MERGPTNVRPNLFVIGATKAGTASLSRLLAEHPDIGMAQGLEPHFFSYGDMSYDSYLERFSHCGGKKVVGDASTSYSRIRYHPGVVDRIAKYCAYAKIIYMVRHPLRRIEAGYIEHLCTPTSLECSSINDAVVRQPMIVDSSRYWEVFDAYRQRFDEDDIKVVWFEEYMADYQGVLGDVMQFLGLEPLTLPSLRFEKVNPRSEAALRMAMIGRANVEIKMRWDPEVRRSVIDQIRADVLALLRHFGRPPDYWGELTS